MTTIGTDFRRTPEHRAAVSAGMRRAHARGQYRNVKKRILRRIKRKRDHCSTVLVVHPNTTKRFCGNECAQKASIGRPAKNKHYWHGQAIREKHGAEILHRYERREGCKLIGRALQINPILVRTVLIEKGVYQPGKIKRLRGGPYSRYAPRRRPYRQTLRSMQARVRRCLNKKPPRVKPITRSMTPAQMFKWRYDNDIEFRLIHVLRSRVRKVVQRGDRYSHCTLTWLGCTPLEFKAHLESLWEFGMTWANYGSGPNQWSIDHRRPCSSGRGNRKRIASIFHYTNMRPMWHTENMAKGSRYQSKHHHKARAVSKRYSSEGAQVKQVP